MLRAAAVRERIEVTLLRLLRPGEVQHGLQLVELARDRVVLHDHEHALRRRGGPNENVQRVEIVADGAADGAGGPRQDACPHRPGGRDPGPNAPGLRLDHQRQPAPLARSRRRLLLVGHQHALAHLEPVPERVEKRVLYVPREVQHAFPEPLDELKVGRLNVLVLIDDPERDGFLAAHVANVHPGVERERRERVPERVLVPAFTVAPRPPNFVVLPRDHAPAVELPTGRLPPLEPVARLLALPGPEQLLARERVQDHVGLPLLEVPETPRHLALRPNDQVYARVVLNLRNRELVGEIAKLLARRRRVEPFRRPALRPLRFQDRPDSDVGSSDLTRLLWIASSNGTSDSKITPQPPSLARALCRDAKVSPRRTR